MHTFIELWFIDIDREMRELLHGDDTVLGAHIEDQLQSPVSWTALCHACNMFSLAISIKKAVVRGQGITHPPMTTFNSTPLEGVIRFCYLGSTMTDNLSLDKKLNTHWEGSHHLWLSNKEGVEGTAS